MKSKRIEEMPEFLKQTSETIRHSITSGIDDSYNNVWDILAELVQNSVDAIRKKTTSAIGKIDIKINAHERTIEISDNGIGISRADLPKLLKMFSSDKKGKSDQIGEKGVGLKFVIFNCNYFCIRTCKGDSSEAVIKGAYDWKVGEGKGWPEYDFKKLSKTFEGTTVKIAVAKKSEVAPIFQLTFEQLKFVLRTRTAIGSTKKIFGDDKNIKISLKYTDLNGQRSEDQVPFEYFLPIEGLKDSAKIDLDDFEKWIKDSDKTNEQKIQKLKGKILYKRKEFVFEGQTVHAFACFVAKRDNWDILTISRRLATEKNLTNEEWAEKNFFCKFGPGIFSSVKGMPTGILLDPPRTYSAGWLQNFFILIEDPTLKFDIGRKSIHGHQATRHKKYAKEVFNEFWLIRARYMTGDDDIDTEKESFSREELITKIKAMVDHKIPGIKFQKSPFEQEAGVAAIFFECIGNGMITGITPIISGYRNKYDLYARVDGRKDTAIFEFKSKLANLIRDIDNGRKVFNEIDCLVCWEITDEDKKAVQKYHVDVDLIEKNELEPDIQPMRFATHKLQMPGNSPIYAIDLKKMLSDSKKKKTKG